MGVKTTAGALPGVGGNIQQALRGLRALPLHEDFAEAPLVDFNIWFKLYQLYYTWNHDLIEVLYFW